MECLSPMNIQRPNGQGNKDRIIVPCGKCAGCLTNRRNDWSLRLRFEHENAKSTHFVTLTYSDDNMHYNDHFIPSVNKEHIQLFMKKIRNHTTEKLRYYCVAEYGTQTKRPHYHILLFNYPNNLIDKLTDTWEYGFVKIGTITNASIHYVTKYHVNKNDHPENAEKGFVLMSRKPGIGFDYIKNYKNYHDENINRAHFTDFSGQIRRLPRYLRDKLYNEQERSLINLKNNEINSTRAEKEKLDHEDINPNQNYFGYVLEQKIEFQKKFKNKINKNDKF